LTRPIRPVLEVAGSGIISGHLPGRWCLLVSDGHEHAQRGVLAGCVGGAVGLAGVRSRESGGFPGSLAGSRDLLEA